MRLTEREKGGARYRPSGFEVVGVHGDDVDVGEAALTRCSGCRDGGGCRGCRRRGRRGGDAVQRMVSFPPLQRSPADRLGFLSVGF
jgi:hypothetical protein